MIPVPSLQDRTGNLSDEEGSLTGTVGGSYWASLLTQKLGYTVTPGEPYYTYTGCTDPSVCVLPNAIIPISAWSAPAANLLKYIPESNLSNNVFSTSAYNQLLHDDKIGQRIDANTRWGTIFGYYTFDDYNENNPYPLAQGGANVPGFNGLYTGRAQMVVLGDTKTFGAGAVNEFRVNYTRDSNDLGQPSGGLGVSLASQAFVTGAGTLGIVPQAPQQGMENIVFNAGSLVIGTVPAQFYQNNNDFGIADNFFEGVGSAHAESGRPTGVLPD